MTNKPRVDIGIAVYNEQHTIKRVVEEVLFQKQDHWLLKSVTVMCDGCTDETVAELQKIENPLLKIKYFSERKGKTYRWNQLFAQTNQADILCLFDGDIEFEDNLVVSKMVKAFADENVAVVGGNSRPRKGKSFFEHAVYTTFQVFDESRNIYKNGHNIFAATGSCMAVRTSFARTLELPNIINEDAYVYLECIRKGHEFRYVSQAKVYYYLPTHLTDYLRQVFRSESRALVIELEPYFGDLVKKEVHRNSTSYIKSVLRVWMSNPLGVTYMAFIHVLCIPFFSFISSRYTLSWFTASSTHNRA